MALYEKCWIISFLGQLMNQVTISPSSYEFTVLEQLKLSKHKKNSRSFRSLLSYFTCQIRNYTTIAKPLSIILKRLGPLEYPSAPPLKPLVRV